MILIWIGLDPAQLPVVSDWAAVVATGEGAASSLTLYEINQSQQTDETNQTKPAAENKTNKMLQEIYKMILQKTSWLMDRRRQSNSGHI